jgi:hypothetical protein
MNGTRELRDQPRRPVAIWHQFPDGPARATAIAENASTLPHPALARLIARRILGDENASVVVDQVVILPPDTAILPAGQTLLDLDEQAHEHAGEPVPEVADPATGTVQVMSRRCDTCIYRRTMRKALGPSVPALIREARQSGGFVICHESLPAAQTPDAAIPPAICHGYATQFPDTYALRVARAIGRIHPIDPPSAARITAHTQPEE